MYALQSARPGSTLDIGAGLGQHIPYEDLSAQEYHAVELRQDMAKTIVQNFPNVHTLIGDCQQGLPYDDSSFDRVVAIHVLEHLPNLPGALSEIRRLLKPDGLLSVVIPCEGGVGYSLGRRVTTQRVFEKRYKTKYRWHVKSDHVNSAREVIAQLEAHFQVMDSTYFPTRVPSVDLNLLIGITCGL